MISILVAGLIYLFSGQHDIIGSYDESENMKYRHFGLYKQVMASIDKILPLTKQMYRDNKSVSYDIADHVFGPAKSAQVDTFIDLCSNPGAISQWILDTHRGARGVGLSLSPSEGGYRLSRALATEYSDRYNQYDFNLLSSKFKHVPQLYDQNKKLCKYDLVHIGCFIKHNQNITMDNEEFQLKSYRLILELLKPGGALIWTLNWKWTIGDMYSGIRQAYNDFETVYIKFDHKFLPALSVVYITGIGYSPGIHSYAISEIENKIESKFARWLEHINGIAQGTIKYP